jgi:hypothetical protein
VGTCNCCSRDYPILVYLELVSQVKMFYAQPNIQL